MRLFSRIDLSACVITPIDYLFPGCCFCSIDVHVCLHILFLVPNWNVDILLLHSKANKLSQLAYDMLVTLFNPCSLFSFVSVNTFLFEINLLS